MKYKAINELNHFEFHDANIVSQKRENGCIEWILDNLNVTTLFSQCDFEEDMCIKEARVLFEQVEVEGICLSEYARTAIIQGQTVHYNEMRKKPLEMAEKVLQDTENSYYRRISRMLGNHGQSNGSFRISFEIENIQEYFSISFRYKSATVEWDEYEDVAQYIKLARQYKKQTPPVIPAE